MKKKIISLFVMMMLAINMLCPMSFAAGAFDNAAKFGSDKYTTKQNYGTEIVQSDKYVFMVLGASSNDYMSNSVIHVYEKPNAQHSDYLYLTQIVADSANDSYDLPVRDIWVSRERLYVSYNNAKASDGATQSIREKTTNNNAPFESYDISNITAGATLSPTVIHTGTCAVAEAVKPYNRGGFSYYDTESNKLYQSIFKGTYAQREGASSNNGSLGNSYASKLELFYNVYDMSNVTAGKPSSPQTLVGTSLDTAKSLETDSLDTVQIYVKDKYLYEVIQNNGGMDVGLEVTKGEPLTTSQAYNKVKVYDVSASGRLTLSTVHKATYLTAQTGSRVIKDIAVSGNYMYLATAQGLEVVNVSAAKAEDASNATLALEETLLSGKDINGIEIFGNILYVGTDEGLSLYSLSDGKATLIVNYVYDGGFADFDVNTTENKLYALSAKQNGGVVVADIDDLFSAVNTVQPIIKNLADAKKEVDGTIVSASNTTQRYDNFWCFSNKNYIEFEFDIPVAGVYRFSSICGAGSGSAGGSATVDVTIDGDVFAKTFSSEKKFTEETYVEWTDYAFDAPGKYTVRIEKRAGDTMTLRSITADMVTELDAPEDYDYIIEKEVSEYSLLPSGKEIVPSDETFSLAPGEQMSWSVIGAYEGHYNLSFTVSGSGARYSGYANGVFIGNATATAALASQACGDVSMYAGEAYTVTIRNNSSEEVLTVENMSLARTSGFVDEIIISDLDIETEEGVRIPYAVIDGEKAIAAVTLREYGEADDEFCLIIAQYNADNQLVNAERFAFDASALEDGETKKIKKEITFDGNGGSVKAFIWENGTLKPLYKSVVYEDDIIFTESDFAKDVTYKNAAAVLTEYGTAYDAALYEIYEDDNCVIEPIFYDSVVGDQTKVFAYLGIPKTASAQNPVPAVVLIHGAAGEAWRDWVKDWNERGYAAISMDLYGCGPEADEDFVNGQMRHQFAGILPWGDLGEGFKINKEEAGMYQNTINIVNAHTLLESLDCVDTSKTGVTGYSYGGVATTVVMGVDDRFEFAVPVYGGGYLDYTRSFIRKGAYQDFKGTSIKWDPVNFAARAKMPVLYINGDYDSAFSVDTTSWTYGVTPNAYLSIRNGLTHSGTITRQIIQIADFADYICKEENNNPYVRITDEKAENGVLTAKLRNVSESDIETVTLYYVTVDELPWSLGTSAWKTSENPYTITGDVLEIELPEDATYCYASVKYVDGTDKKSLDEISISTKLLEVK